MLLHEIAFLLWILYHSKMGVISRMITENGQMISNCGKQYLLHTRLFKMENDRHVDIYVIDDRPIDILISRLLLEKFDNTLIIESFDNAQTALDGLIYKAQNSSLSLPDYIFLDLDMPRLDGWQFLEEYNKSDVQEVKDIQIYILSSSLYREDLKKAFIHPFVKEFVGKPLNMDKIRSIFQVDDVNA